MDGLTIARDLAEKRERIAARLSPMARHQAFPRVYQMPAPQGEWDTKRLTGENERLRRHVRRLIKERDELRAQVDALLIKRASEAQIVAVINCDVVMRAFVEAARNVGYTVEGDAFHIDHFFSKCRASAYVAPRHVCIFLCKKLTRLSLPRIARSFGLADHTSCVHACQKAPRRLAEDALLRAVFDLVMARFNSGEQTEAGDA